MDWLSARDAAKRVGVGYSTFKQWIYQGGVRTTRTRGGHHRISTAEVDRLLDESGRPAARRVATRRSTAQPTPNRLTTCPIPTASLIVKASTSFAARGAFADASP